MLSSLAGLVHGSTTRHVQCAEHGEQIHSDATPVVAIVGAAAHAALRDQPAAAIHDHEHCLMASATRESRIAPCPPAIAIANVARAAPVAAPPPIALVVEHRVYRTAPKTSPPA